MGGRRDFIKKLGVASIGVPLLLHDVQMQAMTSLMHINGAAEDRILVLVRLNGGNDGLNTIIPLDQYANLSVQRSNILIPESEILEITPTIGLHPSMTGMQKMFDDGKLGIIQGVGYPEQNRSHFRSMDIWSSGLIDAPPSTGWLGRKLSNDYPDFPENYPSEKHPHPFAINMGRGVSSTCQGVKSNFSHTVKDPTEEFDLNQGDFIHDGSCHSNQLHYINNLISQTNLFGTEINKAADSGNTMSELYDDNNDLSTQFRNVAKLISGGLKTSIYILNVNGFDTHSDQVNENDVTTGDHADLMKTVSDGIAAFQDDLKLLGLEHRVLGMTFSEFGRQIASNASLGTDHGDAAPLMMFGTCLDFTIEGQNPQIDDVVTKQAAVPMEYDFRNIYATVLKDWFGVATSEIQSMFEHQVNYLSLVSCSVATGIDDIEEAELMTYPNPAYKKSTIRFNCENEWVKIALIDMDGNEVKVVLDSNISRGRQDIPVEIEDLGSGSYIVLIEKESGNLTTKLFKM